ncbi:MAG: hypothetical protein IKM61_04625 [Eubacteriaceae bacterium]|nr:hypothetical protein [Eubacteriaceae bacterium]
MRFTEEDKKNIFISFIISAILFLGAYFAISATGFSADELLTSLRAQNIQSGIAELGEGVFQQTKNRTSPEEFSVEGKVSEIFINISCPELTVREYEGENIRISAEDGKYVSGPVVKTDDTSVEITSSYSHKTHIIAEIPERIMRENSVKVSIKTKNGYVRIINFRDSADDDFIVDGETSIIKASSLNCRKLDITDTAAPVLIGDCAGRILKVETEGMIDYTGSFEEISLQGGLDVMALMTGDFNRIDASSENGFVMIDTNGLAGGFTARLSGCSNDIAIREEATLSSLSKPSYAVYEYGDGSSKINITDTKGKIIIN